jgi:hypothetical protein
VTATVSADKAGARGASATITVSVAGAGSSGAAPSGGGTVLSPPGQVPGVAGLPASATAVEGPPQAQLPLIAPQPAVAPGALPDVQPVSLRTSTTILGLDPESYRLLLIQVAWLTALLVGISLMLTQLRLNRRRLAARGAVRGGGRHPRP